MAKRILVPLDGTARAEAVLPMVAGLARGTGGTVRLLTVVPPVTTRIHDDGRVLAYGHVEEERQAFQAHERLRDVGARLLDGVATEHRVRLGEAGHEIVREADEFDADCIVLATTGGRRRWRTSRRLVDRVRAASRAPLLRLEEGGR